jgi:hypothetical protein
MAETGTSLQKQANLLLALWELGADGTSIKKGDLSKKSRKLKSKERDPLVEDLAEKGVLAVAAEGRTTFFTLKQGFEHEVLTVVQNPDFQFKGHIGKAKANSLLKLFQALKVAPPAIASGNTNGVIPVQQNGNGKLNGAITSYEDFKQMTLTVYNQLNRDFNMDNLVPIYRIRREVGDRVSRSQFSEWLFEMQSEDIFQLLEGSVEDNTTDKLEDSVTTTLGKLRCYAKRLAN